MDSLASLCAWIENVDFRDRIRLAAEMGIVADPLEWYEYRRLRNATSHAYNKTKAEAVYASTSRLLRDALALAATLEQRHG